MKEEISIVQVRLYDPASYFASFMHETQQYLSAAHSLAVTPSQTPRPIMEYMKARGDGGKASSSDQKDEKLLVINKQTINQD